MKKSLSNELLLYPCPTVLVTCKHNDVENVLAVSWIGIASSHPEVVTISVKPSRFSYGLIKRSGVFGINIPNINLINETDYCGNVSGENVDKFAVCKFNKYYSGMDVPLIEECPVNILCSVVQCIELGSHHLFIASVVEKLINGNIGPNDLHSLLSPIAYFRPNYYGLNLKEKLGYYGFTIKK